MINNFKISGNIFIFFELFKVCINSLSLQNNEKLEEVEMSQVTNRIEELNFEIAPSVHDTILTTSLLTNK